jgi:hypothetical protein
MAGESQKKIVVLSGIGMIGKHADSGEINGKKYLIDY